MEKQAFGAIGGGINPTGKSKSKMVVPAKEGYTDAGPGASASSNREKHYLILIEISLIPLY